MRRFRTSVTLQLSLAIATIIGFTAPNLFAQPLSELRKALAEKDKTVLLENDQSSPADVYINFAADSQLNVNGLAGFCDGQSIPPLNCHLTLAPNSKEQLPNPDFKYVNMAVAFNHTVSCGATKAEVIANNPAWYDIMDVSVVDGFNNKVEIKADPGPKGGPIQVIGPPAGQSGNQLLFGVFPFACTICAGILNPPCGSNGTAECHAGSESNPSPPCQYQMNGKDGTITIILQP
jgi:hypothetical protein